jgi:magnesium-protoporphyrin IX monomethyl ester (oxidative) cyclase
VERPALGVSQLTANLREQGFPARILYSNFRFADMIGLDLYQWISNYTVHTMLGEFLFSDVLFHHSDEKIEQYVKNVLSGSDNEDYLTQLFPYENFSHNFRRLMHQALTFCEKVAEEICVQKPWLIGLTSSFQQNCASLAIIKHVKQRKPDILTVMGGANCAAEMGEALFRLFPDVDYIGQGECDHSFVNLIKSLQNENKQAVLPGILSRGNDKPPPAAQLLQSEDLNRLPSPDFKDYFAQMEVMSFADRVSPGLVMETSRGCWWGVKHPCTFCGFNGEDRMFRSKSASRSMDELASLVIRYGIRHIRMVDNILDMRYFKTFLPEHADQPIADLFYETRSNLSKPQVRLLARSQVRWIQPGIESLSDQALQLMRKGTTKMQNIQTLKWCSEYGIWAGWNYLYGFPGENEEEIVEIARELEALHHLQPPSIPGPLRVDRFSTYFNNPAKYRLEPVRPAVPYHYIYPLPNESLKQIAYYYLSDKFENVRKRDAFKTLRGSIKAWQKAYQRSFLLSIPRKGSLILIDTRPCAQRCFHRLVGIRRRVYEYCDKAQTVPEIRNALGSDGDGKLESILDFFVRNRLMIYSDGRYLSLAVFFRPSCGKVTYVPTGDFIKAATRSGITRQRLLRLIMLKIPPRKIAAGIARRANNAKIKLLYKMISKLTNKLSESRPKDESIE